MSPEKPVKKANETKVLLIIGACSVRCVCRSWSVGCDREARHNWSQARGLVARSYRIFEFVCRRVLFVDQYLPSDTFDKMME